MSHRFKDYDLSDVNGYIDQVIYGTLSEEEIDDMAVITVTEMNTYTGDVPVINGLFDKRMGVVDNKNPCITCNQQELCPGHPGKIDLAFPVFLVQFIRITQMVLTCICPQCSKAYLDPNRYSPLQRLFQYERNTSRKIQQHIFELNKGTSLVKRCGDYNIDGCGAVKPFKVDKYQIFKMILHYKNNEKITLNAYHVRQIFSRMTDEQIRYVGLNPQYTRPKDFITRKLLVQSPHIRPAIKADNGSRSQDDLTSKFIDIIKVNNQATDVLQKVILKENPPITYQEKYQNRYPDDLPLSVLLLQYQVSVMIDNNLPQMSKNSRKSGKPIKSIQDRIDQKKGRVRDNLMGKRVDFSARSVITPGASLDINELAVPLKVAIALAVPKYVNRYNIERFQEMVTQEQYPGITSYSQQGRNFIKLDGNPNRHKIKLEIGDTVYKHLEQGDWVVFNRQPSLHKPSLMAHKIVITHDNSFQLPVNSTAVYNADY